MRLVTFTINAAPSIGPRMGVETKSNRVVDLGAAMGKPMLTMREFLEMGEAGLKAAKVAMADADSVSYKLSEVTNKAPIFNPEKVICVGMNYGKRSKVRRIAVLLDL